MNALAIALIAAWAVLLPLGIWATARAERRKQQQETDWIAPHAGWIDDHELDRLVNALVDDAHRAYDQYRGEVW